MKKLICTLLALSLVLAMTACGKQATETTAPETTAPEGALVGSMEELLEKSPLLAQFRAVQNGNVWCTGKNMYQETTQLGQMIQSFRKIFSGEADNLTELPFLYRLG